MGENEKECSDDGRLGPLNLTEDEVEVGSGYTTRSLMGELHQIKTAAFKAQLTSMIRPAGRGGFSKKQVEDMVAGFEDGFRSALLSLKEMGVIVVGEEK